jgi:RimJ/RimL family protein N-acetyltransferase
VKNVTGEAVVQWVANRMNNPAGWPGAVGLGLMQEDGSLAAAAVFENFNGVNIFGHIALTHPRFLRELLTAGARYIFLQLGCRRLTMVAEADNLAAVRMHQRLGGVLEGRLVGASRTGTDILVFRLMHDDFMVRRLVSGKVRRQPESARLREPDPASGTG